MNHAKQNVERATIDYLLRDLLGLDARSLVRMDPMKAYAGIGLHELLRVTIERALSTVWASEGTVFRLQPDASTPTLRRIGWCDARAYNLSTLLAYALVTTARRARGLPHIELSMGDENIVGLPRRIKAGKRTSMAKLVAASLVMFEVDMDAPWPGAHQSVSIADQMRERLGISTEDLVRSRYEGEREATDAIVRDPEGQAVNGISALLIHAFKSYKEVIEQPEIDDTAIRLLIKDDAGARYGNLMHLLLAGLLSEAGRDLAFIIRGDASETDEGDL